MATVKVYNQKKEEIGEISLSPDVFEIDARPEILNFVVRAQLASRRSGTHNAKTRAQVSGGGVKPWKQKGTGRARAGSNRSPLWRGGAIIFGPQPRNYGFKVNKKIRALALKMALSSRLANNNLMVIDNIAIEQPKTKLFAQVADKLGLEKALVVLAEHNETLMRAAHNIPGLTMITSSQLNVMEILNHRQLVLMQDSVQQIQSRFSMNKGA